METFPAYLNKKRYFDPDEYLNLSEDDKKDIQSMRIVPPSLDPNGHWGKIEVEYNRPIYEVPEF